MNHLARVSGDSTSSPSEVRWLSLSGWAVIVVAVMVIVGWVADLPGLISFLSGPPMVMNAALCSLLCGVGLLSLARGRAKVAGVCGAGVAAFCAAILLQLALGRSLGLDQLFWRHQYVSPQTEPGRMAPTAVIALLLAGLMLLPPLKRRFRYGLLPVLAGVVFSFALVAFLNYGFATVQGDGAMPYRGMALPTAVCLLLVALATMRRTGAVGSGAPLPLMAAALGMLIAIGVVLVQSNAELIEANRGVTHTYEVRGETDHFVSEVARLESSVRAFGLTGVGTFADRYDFHRREITRQVGELRRIVTDDPEQRQRVQRLQVLAEQKFSQSEALMRARRQGGAEAAASYLSAQPRELTRALVNLAAEVQAVETRRLEERIRERRFVEQNARLLGLTGGILALLLMGFAVATARRAAAARAMAESALQAANHFQQAVLDGTVYCIIGTTPDGVIKVFNSGAEKMLGYTRGEMIGRQTPALLHVAAEVAARAAELGGTGAPGFETLVADARLGRVDLREWTYVRKDGSHLPVLLSITALRGEAGEITGFLGIANDLTERRQAEAKLRESEERFRSAFDYAGIGIALVGLDGRWLRVNPSLCEILGYDEAALLDKTFQQLTHPDDLARDLANWQAALEGRSRYYHAEKRYLHREGRTVWVRLTVSLVRDAAGKPLNFVAQIEDISEAKRIEQALREGEKRLSDVFRSVAEGLVLQNAAGEIVECNAAAERILGLTRDQLAGRTSLDPRWAPVHEDGTPFPGETHPAWVTLKTGRAQHNVVMGVHKPGGGLTWLSINSEPLVDAAGELQSVVVSFADITPRKQLEESLALARDEALEASRLKSEFLASMSHEIRTPMNGIIGMADLLMETRLTTDQREMGEVVRRSAEHLLTIINDILDFSKVEAGKLRIEDTVFELRPLLEEVIVLLTPRLEGKNLQLLAEFDARLDGQLRGDGGRLRQVLVNLVGNAVKFTEQGSVTVRARCLDDQPDHKVWRMEIADTGIGIPAAAQRLLFQPFVQADGSMTRRFGGTGLGLAIARQLIELMGGEIGFTSEEGRGSTFWFQLRLAKHAGGAPPSPAAAAPGGAVAPGKLRLLVAEDNETNRLVARRFLERMGCEVETAVNGADALRLLALHPYRAVLMDCQMPVMDGYDATRQIRAGAVPGLDPHIPIIALTAFAMPSDRAKCLAAGMDDYLAKPLRMDQLQQAFVRCGLLDVGSADEKPAAPPSPDGDEEILRWSQIEQLRQLPSRTQPSVLHEVVEIFYRDTRLMLVRLRDLVGRQQQEEAVMLAHRLTGSCANLGARAMRQAAFAVEETARQAAWAELPAKLAALDREWERLQAVLQQVRSELAPGGD